MQKATLWLFIATSVISILEVPFPGTSDALALIPPLVSEAPWTLITAIFVHVTLAHLMQNMVGLLIFGSFLEKIINGSRLLLVYFVSGLVGNIAGMVFYPNSMSLGASGAIMGIVGALTILRPKATVWFGAEIFIAFLSAIFIITDLVGLIVPSNIGNAAHLGGFLAGAAFGWMWRKKFSVQKEIQARVRKTVRAKG